MIRSAALLLSGFQVRMSRIVMALSVILAVVLAVEFFSASGNRLFYPFLLEHTEGFVLQQFHAYRRGINLYSSPSIFHIGAMYPPGYYYFGALFPVKLGGELFVLRVVSFVSFCAVLATALTVTAIRTRSLFYGVAICGAMIGIGKYTSCWFDLARVDSCSLFFSFAATALVQTRPTTLGRALICGFLLFIALFIKQTAIFSLLGIVIYFGLGYMRSSVIIALSCLSLLLVAGLSLNIYYDGWFVRYLLLLPASQPYRMRNLLAQENLTLFMAAIPLFAVALYRFSKCERSVWGTTFLMNLLCGALAAAKEGAAVNHFIPAVIFGIMVLGEGFKLEEDTGFGMLFSGSMLALQLLIAAVKPSTSTPPPEAFVEYEKLNEILWRLPKPVLIWTHHGFLVHEVQTNAVANRQAYVDIVWANRREFGRWGQLVSNGVKWPFHSVITYLGDDSPFLDQFRKLEDIDFTGDTWFGDPPFVFTIYELRMPGNQSTPDPKLAQP